MNVKVGDVVQLKAGGPRMTVTRITGTGNAECVWIDREEKEHRSYYAPEALTPARDEA